MLQKGQSSLWSFEISDMSRLLGGPLQGLRAEQFEQNLLNARKERICPVQPVMTALLRLKIMPNAPANAVLGESGGVIRLKLQAQAVDGETAHGCRP